MVAIPFGTPQHAGTAGRAGGEGEEVSHRAVASSIARDWTQPAGAHSRRRLGRTRRHRTTGAPERQYPIPNERKDSFTSSKGGSWRSLRQIPAFAGMTGNGTGMTENDGE